MGGPGVLPGQQGQSGDGVLVDPDESGRLAGPASLGQMLQDGQDLLVRQVGVEERGAVELGEAVLAGPAVEQAMLGLAEAIDDQQVADISQAVEAALGVAAAEVRQILGGGHDRSQVEWCGETGSSGPR